MNSSQYLLISAQGNSGPFSFDQIKLLFSQGQIQESTLIQSLSSQTIQPLKNYLALEKIPSIPTKYASFFQRFFLANTLDGFLLILLTFPVVFITNSVATYLLTTTISCLYFFIPMHSKLQSTLGQYAIGLKISDLNGNKLSAPHLIAYLFMLSVCWITLGLSCLTLFFTTKKQMLHDLLTGVIVTQRQ